MGRELPRPHAGGWRQEWGLLTLLALLALPMFTPRLYAADEIKYFAFLRSAYFDHDLQFANEYQYFLDRDPAAHAGFRPYIETVTPTGHRLNDAPIGSALMWAPFYAVADLTVIAARWLGSGVPRDGFSQPYVWAVCVGSLFWGMVGIFLVYRLCREFAEPGAAKLAAVGVWFASPLVFYLYVTPPMGHANSLFTVALFLFLWYQTRDRRRPLEWALLGVSAGLMVLVRELNWLMLLVLLVDECTGLWETWRGRELYGHAGPWLQRFDPGYRMRGYAAFLATLAVIVAPQFAVYSRINGTLGPAGFIVDKFGWFPWHAGEVLFSGFHGLFSWHPVTLLGILGLWALSRRHGQVALALTVVFVSQVLVIGSYDTWWGGAAFGARRFANCVPVFAVGLAAFAERLRPSARRSAWVLVVALVVWNFGLAIQYSTGMIPRDQPVSMRTIAYNQFVEVPPRLLDIAWRFLTDRGSFYRTRA